MNRHIAIIIESLGGGGAQHVASSLANAWCAAGVDVSVITFQPPGADVFRVDDRIRRTVIGGSYASKGLLSAISSNLRRLVRLRRALRQSGADIFLSFVGSTNILTIAASRGLSGRTVISERNDPHRQSLGAVWDFLRWLTYRFADLVIANSQQALLNMQRFVPSRKLLWLPNPLRSAPDSKIQPPDIPSRPYFLSVGRLTHQKAYDLLLHSFVRVHQVLPGHQLFILGEGPLRPELEKQVAFLQLQNCVRLLGYAENPFAWYRRAVALIHPARFEGLPNAVLEAMSEYVPVVVTAAQQGLKDIVKDGESGIVVPTESIAALADAMLRLAGSEGLRRQLGAGAFAAVQPFLADRAIARWSAALDLKFAGRG